MIAGACLLLMLPGCASSTGSGLVKPDLPPIPSDLSERCRDPDVPDYVDSFASIAAHRKALSDCDKKRARAVAFYENVRTGLK